MVKLIVDGRPLEAPAGITILEAVRKLAVKIPTLCAWDGRKTVGSCRVCLVEVKGAPRLVAACRTYVEDGMEIFTHSARVLAARRTNVELLLAEHDCRCLECAKNGKCELQTLAQTLGILAQPFPNEPAVKHEATKAGKIVRNDAKCVKCLKCIEACNAKGIKLWRFFGSGKNAYIGVKGGKLLEETACDFCGDCVSACPTAALTFAH